MDPNHPPRPPEPKNNHWLRDSVRDRFQADFEAGKLRLGQQIRLECHEVWEYEHNALVQRLTGLVPLCTLCHQVKHWGWLERGGNDTFWVNEWRLYSLVGGQPQRITLEQHFMETNGCGLALMREHVKELSILHLWRSQYQWVVDFGHWTPLVDPDKVSEFRKWNTEVQQRRREGKTLFF